MLRKIFALGAIVVVAVTFGVSSAAAKAKGHGSPPTWSNGNGDGFSDGR